MTCNAPGQFRHLLSVLRLIESPTRDTLAPVQIDADENWDEYCTLRAELLPARSARQSSAPAEDGAVAQSTHRWRIRHSATAAAITISDRIVFESRTHTILSVLPEQNNRRFMIVEAVESHP